MTFKILNRKKFVFKINNFVEKKESDLIVLEDDVYH